MSSLAIRRALETAVAAITPALSTCFENVEFKPVSGTPYQRVSILLAKPQNPTFGNAHTRRVGYMQVDLCYPQNVGPAAAAARADLTEAAFYRGLSLTANSVTTVIDRTPEIAPGRMEGDRYIIPVRVYFYSDTVN